MAEDKKITALVAKTTVHDGDVFPIVDLEEALEANQNKKITGANMKTEMTSAHAALTTGVHGGGIGDADGDTKIQTEESADEDIIRMDVAGVEAFNLQSAGILTLAKQSGAKAYPNTQRQTVPNATTVRLLMDTELHDFQNEFNSTVKTGTADASESSKLHDADGGFAASDVGAWIWNTTDNTYTQVTAFVDSGELTLADDIMVSGEGYILYHSTFTATEAGVYLVTTIVTWWQVADGVRLLTFLYRNGGSAGGGSVYSSAVGSYPAVVFADLVQMAASDYLELRIHQASGGVLDSRSGVAFTNWAVQKVA